MKIIDKFKRLGYYSLDWWKMQALGLQVATRKPKLPDVCAINIRRK